MNENLVCIGKILSPNGLKGFVNLESYSVNLQYYIENYQLLDDKNNTYKIHYRSKSKHLVVSIDNINSVEDAEKLKQTKLYISRDHFKDDLEEDEFFIIDLVGLNVVDINNNDNIGVVDNVFNYGAGDIISIKFNDGKDELIMFSEDYFPKIDIKSKKIYLSQQLL